MTWILYWRLSDTRKQMGIRTS